MTACDILNKAREIAAKYGHCKNMAFRDASGWPCEAGPTIASVCMLGAIYLANPKSPKEVDYLDMEFRARNALSKVVGNTQLSVWNDQSHITKADVLDAFDKALTELNCEG